MTELFRASMRLACLSRGFTRLGRLQISAKQTSPQSGDPALFDGLRVPGIAVKDVGSTNGIAHAFQREDSYIDMSLVY